MKRARRKEAYLPAVRRLYEYDERPTRFGTSTTIFFLFIEVRQLDGAPYGGIRVGGVVGNRDSIHSASGARGVHDERCRLLPARLKFVVPHEG